MPAKSRNRQLAAVGAVVGAAGLAYGAYCYFVGENDRGGVDRGGNATGSTSGKGKEPEKKRHRGTLSLCCSELPPLNLLESLCSSYTLHLILRTDAPSSPSDPDNPYPRPPVPSELYGIPGLDTRRVLFYSRPAGRIHVARALGCDVHVELLDGGKYDRSGPIDSNGEGSWVLPEEEVTPERLVRDLKTFVGSLVLVMGEEQVGDEVAGANVRVVKTFAEAVKLLL